MDELQLLQAILIQLEIMNFTIVLFFVLSWTKKLVIRMKKGMGANE
jgi:hypothetical protein